MNRKLDWLPAAVFLVFGLVFFVAALNIRPGFGGATGSKHVPLAATAVVILLSLINLSGFVLDWMRSRKHRESEPTVDELMAPDDVDHSHILAGEFFRYSLPLLLTMGVYAYFQTWFGYAAATIFTGFIVFFLFGNSWKSILIGTAVTTAVLYTAFIRVLHVYNPPGRLIDFSWLF